MRIVLLFLTLAAVTLLVGCAETPQTTDDHPAGISVPVTTANPETPSPTLSGYVDTSYTSQGR